MDLEIIEKQLRESLAYNRYENDLYEKYGKNPTNEQKLEVAKSVLSENPDRGVMGLIYEQVRRSNRHGNF